MCILLSMATVPLVHAQAPPPRGGQPSQVPTAPAAPLPAGDDVKATSTAPEEALRIGDEVEIRVEVTHPSGFEFETPEATRVDAGRLRLEEIVHTTPPHPGEEEVDLFVFRCSIYFVGRFYFPPVSLVYVDGEGVRRALLSEQVSIKVVSLVVEGEDAASLRDNLVPNLLLEPDYRPLQGAAVLLCALLLVGLGIFLARRAKRRRLARPAELPPPRPAWELAWEQLQALQDRLPDEESRRELYFDLSEIMRGYLGARYGFDALEMTTSEVIAALREVRFPRGIDKRALEGFLLDCDLVKFARYRSSLEETSANLIAAQNVVERTRPATPSPADDAARGEHVG